MKINLRNYKDSDYGEVKETLIQSNPFYAPMDSRKNLKRLIERNPEAIILATVKNKIVGNVFIVENGWSAFIYRLSVRPKYRKHGIGLKLMSEAEKRIRKLGYPEVYLFVNESYKKLKYWYKKQRYYSAHIYRFMTKRL